MVFYPILHTDSDTEFDQLQRIFKSITKGLTIDTIKELTPELWKSVIAYLEVTKLVFPTITSIQVNKSRTLYIISVICQLSRVPVTINLEVISKVTLQSLNGHVVTYEGQFLRFILKSPDLYNTENLSFSSSLIDNMIKYINKKYNEAVDSINFNLYTHDSRNINTISLYLSEILKYKESHDIKPRKLLKSELIQYLTANKPQYARAKIVNSFLELCIENDYIPCDSSIDEDFIEELVDNFRIVLDINHPLNEVALKAGKFTTSEDITSDEKFKLLKKSYWLRPSRSLIFENLITIISDADHIVLNTRENITI